MSPLDFTEAALVDNATVPRALDRGNMATPSQASDAGAATLPPTVAPRLRPLPLGVETDDALSVLTAKEAADWYRRLALLIQGMKPDSLAAALLLWWLDGKSKPYVFSAKYVQSLSYVTNYLQNEVRPVLLTDKKIHANGIERWGGIVKRLKSETVLPGDASYTLMYEGPPVEIPLVVQAKAIAAFELGLLDISPEMDAFAALHKFGLHTDAVLHAVRIDDSTRFAITFTTWKTHVFDQYDWDPTKHLRMPNPDFGNSQGLAPDQRIVTVYHRNALRVEQAGLAAPYNVQSEDWSINDPAISGPAEVDTARSL